MPASANKPRSINNSVWVNWKRGHCAQPEAAIVDKDHHWEIQILRPRPEKTVKRLQVVTLNHVNQANAAFHRTQQLLQQLHRPGTHPKC